MLIDERLKNRNETHVWKRSQNSYGVRPILPKSSLSSIPFNVMLMFELLKGVDKKFKFFTKCMF
jgi:hypothetical protein